MDPALQLVVLLLALVGFWFIVMRPARNAQRRQLEVQRSVEVGDRVIIAAGIFGTVSTVEHDRVGLEVAPGTVITVARQAVVRRLDETASDTASGSATSADADDTEE